MKRSLLLLALIFQITIAHCQTPCFISDSIARLLQNLRLDSSVFEKMVMTTDGMGDYQSYACNPQMKIKALDSTELLGILESDTSTFKIVLLWSCWSKYGISEMVSNKYLFDPEKYSLYLISADLNTKRQLDTINKFLTSLGVSHNAWQIRSRIDLSDLQNSRATASFINALTGHKQEMVQLDVCRSFPNAMVYDKANNIVKSFDGHFCFSDLAQYKKRQD
jgi:hypothetical protein